MYSVIHIVGLAVTIGALARFLPGVEVRSSTAALIVAIVFSVLSFFLGWLLTFFLRAVLFVPALLSLGLLFVIVPFLVNAVLLWLTDKLIDSFEIRTFRALAISSAVLTVVSGVFHSSYARTMWEGHRVGNSGWM